MVRSVAERSRVAIPDPTVVRADADVVRDRSRVDVVHSGLEGRGVVVIGAKIKAPHRNPMGPMAGGGEFMRGIRVRRESIIRRHAFANS